MCLVKNGFGFRLYLTVLLKLFTGSFRKCFYHVHFMTITQTHDHHRDTNLGLCFEEKLRADLPPFLSWTSVKSFGKAGKLEQNQSFSLTSVAFSQASSWSLSSEACPLCCSSSPIKLSLAAFLHYCMGKD